MDSFKLVPFRAVSVALLAGALSALAALAFHVLAAGRDAACPRALLTRYVAPVDRGDRSRRSTSSSCCGSGGSGSSWTPRSSASRSGTGFALVENLEYLRTVNDERLILWLVRGFGPAILHGAMHGALRDPARRACPTGTRSAGLVDRAGGAGACRSSSIRCSTTSRCRRSSRRASCWCCCRRVVTYRVRAERARDARVGGRGARSRRRAAEPGDVLRRSGARASGSTSGSSRSDSRARWWPTCSACCGSNSSWRSGPRGC